MRERCHWKEGQRDYFGDLRDPGRTGARRHSLPFGGISLSNTRVNRTNEEREVGVKVRSPCEGRREGHVSRSPT